jgi:hypothetical protein
MKTDVVLTTGEYLAMCCDSPNHVNPPGKDARHIPITAGEDAGTKNEEQGCRCDRWGHSCPRSTNSFSAHQFRILITENRGEQNGIPDCNWHPRDGGTVRRDHRRLFATARVVITRYRRLASTPRLIIV